jgi:hypothetical protein
VRVAIVGSREYPDPQEVRAYVADLPPETIVVSGGARGVDTTAAFAAVRRGLTCEVIRADWRRHGKRAGFLRNREVVARADRVVAFWDGESRGTKHAIDLARAAGKSVEVILRARSET